MAGKRETFTGSQDDVFRVPRRCGPVPSLIHRAPTFTVPRGSYIRWRNPMSERSIGIALLGHGVVGSGVLRILTEQRDLLRQRTGLTFNVRHVVVKDPAKHQAAKAFNLLQEKQAEKAINDPAVDIVVELVGGT